MIQVFPSFYMHFSNEIQIYTHLLWKVMSALLFFLTLFDLTQSTWKGDNVYRQQCQLETCRNAIWKCMNATYNGPWAWKSIKQMNSTTEHNNYGCMKSNHWLLREGYVSATRDILTTTRRIAEAIRATPGVTIVGHQNFAWYFHSPIVGL